MAAGEEAGNWGGLRAEEPWESQIHYLPPYTHTLNKAREQTFEHPL